MLDKKGIQLENHVKKEVDRLAAIYFVTKDEKCMEDLLKIITPTVEMFAKKYARYNVVDSEDLAQELLLDVFKLVSIRWKPNNVNKFHYLLLRQLRNKCINNNRTLNKNARYTDLPFHLSNGENIEKELSDKRLVKTIKDSVCKHGNYLKARDLLILELLLNGHNKSEICVILEVPYTSLVHSLRRIRGLYDKSIARSVGISQ